MATAGYTTDLVLINNAEGGTWGELGSPYNAGASPTINDTDYFIQGAGCTTQALSASKSGLAFSLYFDNGSDLSGNFTANETCVFFWQVLLAGNAMETFSNGGLRLAIGNTISDLNVWFSGGRDFGRNPYGGWQNIAINPSITPDQVIGSPSTAYQIFASILNTTSVISKGNVHGVDAIRYGRGQLLITGGSLADGYANFTGMSFQNDLQNNRWGLFQTQGVGYLWKGLMQFGTSGILTEFVDQNKNITIDDTPRTYENFNKIEFYNTGSTVRWTGIFFNAANSSQLSRGSLEMVDNVPFTADTCTFTDMNNFIFDSNSELYDVTFRRCSGVTQNSGIFNGCNFENSLASASIVADNIGLISNCNFRSDGLNHAIELTAAHSGGSYTLTNCIYVGYATTSGSTGNEVIYNNSGGAVTINIDGGDVPSYRNGVGSTTNIVANTVVTVTGLKDLTEVRVYASGSNIELAGVEDATDGTTDNRFFSFSLPQSTVVDIVYINKLYDSIPPRTNGFTIPASNTSFSIVQLLDPNYNGSGT